MTLIDHLLRFLELLVSSCTLATLVWGLFRMFKSARAAEEVRTALVASTGRAEVSAATAAEHSEAVRSEMVMMAENVQKIETASNSMKDALVAASDKAGELRGRQEERDRKP
jgi:hypothetical protein